jgi:glycine cleavage system H lipoate-binding protein
MINTIITTIITTNFGVPSISLKHCAQAGRASLPPQIAAAAEEKRTAALEAVKATRQVYLPMGNESWLTGENS